MTSCSANTSVCRSSGLCAIGLARACRRVSYIVTIIVCALVVPRRGAALQARLIALHPANAVSKEEFTRVTSIRELRDGSLLVADQGEGRLVRIRLDSNTIAAPGRVGNGPAEFRGVGWLFPLGRDSTLFTDSSLGRWFILEGSRIVETISEHGKLNQLLQAELSGVDDFGHVLGVRGSVFSGTAPRIRPTADSLVILLADRRSLRIDTLGEVKGRGSLGFHVEPASNRHMMRIFPSAPFGSEDQALLFPDGWVAVARISPYRVDWRARNGRWNRGAALPFQAITLDDKEKCAAMERFLGRSEGCNPSMMPGWPEIVPPFLPAMVRNWVSALLAAPDGSLVIARTPTAAAPENRYDVVDRAGRLVGVITLARQEVLIGFGTQSAYVLAVDEDGIQTLRRHPWP